jgi:hypothetical protein
MVLNTYEQQLTNNSRWALSEAGDFFVGKGGVQESLRKIAKRLDELKVPYAVVGALALFQHGFRRFTEDVDLLVTREGLTRIHEALDGLGYVPPFQGSKQLRDADTGVKIEFLVAGEYPGDGKPKPVVFPDPGAVAIERDGIRYVDLPLLIDLKIASGLTNPGRLKDLADVQELIKHLHLPRGTVEQLNPYVQEKFVELWDAVQQAPSEEA